MINPTNALKAMSVVRMRFAPLVQRVHAGHFTRPNIGTFRRA
jgi:hypothetical protein